MWSNVAGKNSCACNILRSAVLMGAQLKFLLFASLASLLEQFLVTVWYQSLVALFLVERCLQSSLIVTVIASAFNETKELNNNTSEVLNFELGLVSTKASLSLCLNYDKDIWTHKCIIIKNITLLKAKKVSFVLQRASVTLDNSYYS